MINPGRRPYRLTEAPFQYKFREFREKSILFFIYYTFIGNRKDFINMAYHVGNGIWDGVFAVPNIVADAHLKLASGLSVKVLLLVLPRGGQVEIPEMAALLGQSATDIQDAVNHWVAQGVLAEAGTACSETEVLTVQAPAPAEEPSAAPLRKETVLAAAPEPDTGPRKVTTLSSSRPRLTTQEINELARQDENITYLLQETQTVLGKPLTPVASSTMASLYSYTGMQPDLILMLVHYCVSIGKDSMRYIERVADDWMDKGIDSHEKAEAEILRLTRQNGMENKVKTAFGIYDRSLVPSEKEYIRTWTDVYKLELDLIRLAYERSVEIKGKLSFAYINGILGNWHKAGVTTPAQALEEIKSGKGKTAPQKETGSSYDIGEMEKMINTGNL